MKKILCVLLATAICGSFMCLTGCSQLDVAEQPEPVVIYAEKIYPSAIGNYLTDASVKVPAIDAYMKEYNKNADETAKINYDVIKYNKTSGYYYVNDNTTDVGIKFRVDQAGTICSATIYTGTLDQTGKNIYNVVVNAIETAGYKTLMTDQDKAIIQHTLNGFNNVSQSKTEVMQIFNGQEDFGAKWNNAVAEFEIPIKPTELPKPDTSHTLDSITMPTVEIPAITLDTTIVEGVHIANGVEVKQQDIDSIVTKIETATKEIAEVEAYNKTTPDGVNAILDDIVLNKKKLEAEKLLDSAKDDIISLLESPETSELPVTEELTELLQGSYKSFYEMTFPGLKPDVENALGNSNWVTNDANSFVASVIGGGGGGGGGHLVVDGQPTQAAKDTVGALMDEHNDLKTLPTVTPVVDQTEFDSKYATNSNNLAKNAQNWVSGNAGTIGAINDKFANENLIPGYKNPMTIINGNISNVK